MYWIEHDALMIPNLSNNVIAEYDRIFRGNGGNDIEAMRRFFIGLIEGYRRILQGSDMRQLAGIRQQIVAFLIRLTGDPIALNNPLSNEEMLNLCSDIIDHI
jgi:hypothetical protein